DAVLQSTVDEGISVVGFMQTLVRQVLAEGAGERGEHGMGHSGAFVQLGFGRVAVEAGRIGRSSMHGRRYCQR
ncbi:MAG: hypothetical protein JO145_00065, partial [Acidobacteriaceae bacterium]|nr:hypothetical protein [Acidobacteriaceae bacterium]